MKNLLKIFAILLVCSSLSLSCQKDDLSHIVKFNTIPPAKYINYTSATVTGSFLDIGEGISSYGHCWAINQNPTILDSITIKNGYPPKQTEFISELTRLIPGTKYYVKAYAKTSEKVFYSDAINFTTPDTVSDVDGNVYHVISIGSQLWTKENLKTTKFKNSDPIPVVTDNDEWYNLTTPGYCWYNNYSPFKDQYGALYNWYAVTTGNLCPDGWHVPNDANWTTLINFLGGEEIAANKLKEAGTANWNSPNTGATNESGFTALPCGQRDHYGTFYDLGTYTYLWNSIECDEASSWSKCMNNSEGYVYHMSNNKKKGFSVRCIKD